MESIKMQLMDMGFNEAKVKRAIESCPEAQTLEQVMEWLIAHEDEINTETSSSHHSGSTSKVADKSAAKADNQADCPNGNPKESDESAVNMAARKKITVEEAQLIITERQAKRAEEERKKEIEDEKRRRIDGQKMAETRAELQDQERIRLAQQIRREKLEKEAHRRQVLEQIAQDREAMKLRNDRKSLAESSTSSSNNNASSSACSPSNKPKISVTECRIALRFPDGSSLVHKFSPQEQLAAVRLFVQMEKGPAGDIEFVAPPNKKLSDSMMNETLESLGLCPASRLEVKYGIHRDQWVDLD